MLKSLLCISAGASAGAIARWGLGLALNAASPLLPLGTLAANLLGAFGIGLALGFFHIFPGLGAEWRLLLVTGFLGSFTTFSAFSAEICGLVQQGRLTAALLGVVLHVGGSLLLTSLGLCAPPLLRAVLRG